MTPKQMSELNVVAVNTWNLIHQHLAPESQTRDLLRIVRDIGGLHATSSTTPYLSLLARSPGFKSEYLDRELHRKRSLGRIRCVRGTIYIHVKDMIPVVYAATASFLQPATQRFMQTMGVSEGDFRHTSRAILKLLSGRELTASAIRSALGITTDISSILYRMCDLGLLIRARPEKGWKDKNPTYALFAEYFPDIELTSLTESYATVALIRSYINAFGPVTETDIAWWTGLGKTKVRAALTSLEPELTNVRIADLCPKAIMFRKDERRVADPDPSGTQVVHLLPILDPYPMGYKERGRYLDPADQELVFDRGGNITSTILVAGRVIGVWDFEQEPHPCVKLYFFRGLSRWLRRKIHEEAERVGGFLADAPVRLRTCTGMTPLRLRGAGGFMSPLKGV